MERPLLQDPNIAPVKEVLQNILKESYPVFEEMMEIITDTKYGLVPEWNYYRDGKAWLCKVVYKKKTVFWLSVWDKYFRTSFYFTEKHLSGIAELEIEKSIMEDFRSRKPTGKLFPLVITLSRKEQIKDLLKIIEFKKSLK
jgi:hypothetical protein